MKKYHKLEDGEARLLPAQFRSEVYHKMACCDCGLTHRVRLRKVKAGIELTAWRDERATAVVRRARATPVHSVAAKIAASRGKASKSL